MVVPAGQVCCGALAAHAGVRDVARELARANFGAFCSGRFRRDSDQRRRMRLDAEGIRALFSGDASGARAAADFPAKCAT